MHLTLYLWTLGLSVLAVNLVNIFCIPSDYALWQLLLFGILNPIAIFGIDALVATVIHKMPAKYFSPYKKAYKSHKWEKKFYKAIKIGGMFNIKLMIKNGSIIGRNKSFGIIKILIIPTKAIQI